MEVSEVQKSILNELERLEHARKIRNFGMARVCGRRASGMAIGYWLEKEPREEYGTSYIAHLKALMEDETIHPDVREAAKRLTAHKDIVNRQEISLNPLSDAVLIIRYVENKTGDVLLEV